MRSHLLHTRSSRTRRSRLGALSALLVALALLASACVGDGSWTATAPANAPTDAHFHSVSCPTTTFCMAVGEGALARPAVQVWNGSSWSRIGFGLTTDASELVEVACAAPTSCLVTYVRYDALDQYESVAHWDGTTWTRVPGSFSERKFHLGCAPDGYCLMSVQWFAKVWDGTAAHDVTGPEFAEAEAISCVVGRRCLSVSAYGDAQWWDGVTETWEPEDTIPAPPGQMFVATSVSCTSATRCLAVGSTTPDHTTHFPAAALWNGTSWTATALPIAGEGKLISLSCGNPFGCLAIGSAAIPSGVEHAVAVAWTGNAWQAIAPPSADATMHTESVSCAPGSTTCLAVGWKARRDHQVLKAWRYTWTD